MERSSVLVAIVHDDPHIAQLLIFPFHALWMLAYDLEFLVA
jgi:hypothetical protein